MERIVNVHEAKTHLSRILDRVIRGEEVVIGKAGRPVARIVPVHRKTQRRAPGSARGRIRILPSFDASLPGAIRKAFEG
jgi:prevent-host-death family protein